jgi:predicted lactoylglutathione lyase
MGYTLNFHRVLKALGFTQNLQFSDDTAACMAISAENYVMLLTHEKFKGFSAAAIPDARTSTGLMVALECKSRADVDAKCKAALAAGGSEYRPTMDLGFMYNRAFSDPEATPGNPFTWT